MSIYRQSLMLRKLIPLSLQINETRNIHRWVAPTLKELKRRRDKIGPEPLKPRSTFLEWNYEAEIFAFGKRLGENFDKNLLKKALTHRSYVMNKTNEDIEDNSELIKEGDSIISEFIISEYRKIYPDDIVKSLHKYLISENILSDVASQIGLKDIILTSEFPVLPTTLSNTFKAIIAALSKSQNLDNAHKFIKDFLFTQLNGKDVYDIWNPENPYDYLTKLINGDVEPRICNQSAVNTVLANYQVGLYRDRQLLGIGWGESVCIAKETAALDAIRRIFDNYVLRK